mgnify:CR=1 FL=1
MGRRHGGILAPPSGRIQFRTGTGGSATLHYQLGSLGASGSNRDPPIDLTESSKRIRTPFQPQTDRTSALPLVRGEVFTFGYRIPNWEKIGFVTKMKSLSTAILLPFLFLTSASARLGENLEQCIERYGDPTFIAGEDAPKEQPKSIVMKEGISEYYFNKGGFEIRCEFFMGIETCILITYRKVEKIRLRFEEIENFLKINAPGRTFEKHDSTLSWRESNLPYQRRMEGYLANCDGQRFYLSVCVPNYSKMTAPKDNTSTEGL